MYHRSMAALGVSPTDLDVAFHPASAEDLDRCRQQLRTFIHNPYAVERIVGLALIGEFAVLHRLYPDDPGYGQTAPALP